MNRTLCLTALLALAGCGLPPADDQVGSTDQALRPIGPPIGTLPPPIIISPPVNPPPLAATRVFDFDNLQIEEIQVDVENSVPTTYETRNCTPGTDPVMHMFIGTGSDARIAVAYDDNSGGGVNAKFTVPQITNAGIAFLMLRAQGDARGACDIWRRSLPWRFNVPVGGKMIFVNTTAGEAVETVSRPNGSQYQTLYRMQGTGPAQKISSGGTGLSARYVLLAASAQFLVSSQGPSRLVVNDVNSDTDGDGLGDQLEVALGTCAKRNTFAAGTFDCNLPATTADTDGDGLNDGWEVLGKRDMQPHQLLPQWGADPRHKDLFAEVDCKDEGMPVAHLPPDQALIAATFFQDTAETSTPIIQLFRGQTLLANPDQRPGVNLHLDTGIGANSPADATTYGNWGGFNVAAGLGDWTVDMVAARRGVFHWVLGLHTGAGQTGIGSIVSVVNITSLNAGQILAHELGHGVGLDHDGNDSAGKMNGKPQYASIMN